MRLKVVWRKFTSLVSGKHTWWHTIWMESPDLQFIFFLPNNTLGLYDLYCQNMPIFSWAQIYNWIQLSVFLFFFFFSILWKEVLSESFWLKQLVQPVIPTLHEKLLFGYLFQDHKVWLLLSLPFLTHSVILWNTLPHYYYFRRDQNS